MNYEENRFRSADGLDLYYRDYPGSGTRVPLLCLSGLTRNSKDFHDLASRVAPGRRVLSMDYRGRGRSAYDPTWQNYKPPVYVGDTVALMAAAGVDKAILFGTSLGGIVSMILAATAPQKVAGVILNDIGPDLHVSGLQRIAGYVGIDVRMKDFVDAGNRLKIVLDGAYPDLPASEWTRFAERTFVKDEACGDLRLDYDLSIAKVYQEQTQSGAPAIDLWPLFHCLRDIPTLALRGGLSDLLSVETFAKMAVGMPNLTQVTVPNRGHVPLLDESDSIAAINGFLAKV